MSSLQKTAYSMAVPTKHYQTPHGLLQRESILLFFTMQQSTGFEQFNTYTQ